jgi:hypothetical protein
MLSIFSRRVPAGTWASAISPTFLPIRAAPIGDFSEILPAQEADPVFREVVGIDHAGILQHLLQETDMRLCTEAGTREKNRCR